MDTKKAASADRQCNTTEDILSRLGGVRKTGFGWLAKCPSHEDRNASLSIAITPEGKLLAHCFAGCSFDEIRRGLGLSGERFEASPQRKEEGPTPEQIEAQVKALRIWKRAKPAQSDHSYLLRKKIKPYHARIIGDSLIIPMQNARGDLWNVQFIHPDGTKRFLKGGMTKSLFAFIGEVEETGRIYVTEGFATGGTVHQLTGKPCMIAFSASNLPSVAHTVRRAFTQAEIVICSDNDEAGKRYSEEAARSIDGLVAYAGRAV